MRYLSAFLGASGAVLAGLVAVAACGEPYASDDASPSLDGAPTDATAPDATSVDGGADSADVAETGADGDSATDGGDDGGDGGCNGRVNCQRVVFVTHDTFNGQDLDSVANADVLCTDRAHFFSPVPRVKDRVFRAWLSAGGAAANARLVHGSAPYIRTDGQIIANDWADLTDGTLAKPINLDSTGMARGGTAWTGTTASGALAGSGDCGSWNDAAAVGTVGNVDSVDGMWTSAGVFTCGTTRHLYCVEE